MPPRKKTIVESVPVVPPVAEPVAAPKSKKKTKKDVKLGGPFLEDQIGAEDWTKMRIVDL